MYSLIILLSEQPLFFFSFLTHFKISFSVIGTLRLSLMFLSKSQWAWEESLVSFILSLAVFSSLMKMLANFQNLFFDGLCHYGYSKFSSILSYYYFSVSSFYFWFLLCFIHNFFILVFACFFEVAIKCRCLQIFLRLNLRNCCLAFEQFYVPRWVFVILALDTCF